MGLISLKFLILNCAGIYKINVEVMPGYLGFDMIPPFHSGDRKNPSLQKKQAAGSCHYSSSCRNVPVQQPVFFTFPNTFYLHKLTDFQRDQKLSNGGGEYHSDPYFELNPDPDISRSENGKHRFLLILRSEDPGILRYKMGKNYSHLLNSYLCLIKMRLSHFEADNIIYKQDLVHVDFTSAKKAISCMLALNNALNGIADKMALKMILKQGAFSGDSYEELRTDHYFFYKLNEQKPVVDHNVMAIAGYNVVPQAEAVNVLVNEDQRILRSFLKIIRDNWQNSSFNVAQLCNRISSSKSRFYRRCKELTGFSPIGIIKEYRLLRCLSVLKSQKKITTALYDSGFNTPSYFSRCFKKRYGISPQYYQKHLI